MGSPAAGALSPSLNFKDPLEQCGVLDPPATGRLSDLCARNVIFAEGRQQISGDL